MRRCIHCQHHFVALFAARRCHKGSYHNIGWLYVSPLILMLSVLRIWLLAQRGGLPDDPAVFALKDRVSWNYALAIAVLWALAVIY